MTPDYAALMRAYAGRGAVVTPQDAFAGVFAPAPKGGMVAVIAMVPAGMS